jgi:hypothetical protein
MSVRLISFFSNHVYEILKSNNVHINKNNVLWRTNKIYFPTDEIVVYNFFLFFFAVIIIIIIIFYFIEFQDFITEL